jgi:hypothetical protein
LEVSNFRATTLHDFFEGNGAVLAIADTLQCTLGEIQIFEIFQVLHDGLAGIEALSAPGTAREFLKTLHDGLWKPDDQHERLLGRI